MKKNITVFCLVILQALILFRLASCGEIKSLPEFTDKDRVLILAAHPDDESIAAAGVIQKARMQGAFVRVVCFTNGEHNELSFIVFEKRLTFRKGEFIHMGEVRSAETVAAMKFLGLNEKDIMFLGYPDFGTQEILTKYWHTPPRQDFLTRISRVPYPESLSPDSAYVGENVLKDLKSVLLDFKPTKIFVSHPVDTNRDHRSLYVFLKVALWDLEKQINAPEVFPYLVHVIGWPKPRGYHPDLSLIPPEKFKDSSISWFTLELSQSQITDKKKALSLYKSQIPYNPPYMLTFDRENELFGDYPPVKLIKQIDTGDNKEINWQYLSPGDKKSKLAYAHKDGYLYIKFDIKKRLGRSFGVSVYLLGYSEEKEFADMPKINIELGLRGLRIKDKKDVLFVKDAKVSYKTGSLIMKMPLALLGEPHYILSYARAKVKNFPLDDTAWRVLELE